MANIGGVTMEDSVVDADIPLAPETQPLLHNTTQQDHGVVQEVATDASPVETASTSNDDSDSDSGDDLPSYDAVASVRDNETNLSIKLRQIGQDPITVQAAEIDSVAQLKQRICKATGVREDSSARMELRRTADIHILDGSKSLAQLRIKNGTSLDLCTLNAEGKLIGPDDDGSMVMLTQSTVGESRAITLATPGRGAAAALPGSPKSGSTAAGKESVVVEVEEEDEDAPPPEYSMIDRVRLARGERRTTMSRSEYAVRAILTSIAILVVLGLFIALPVALISVGFNNMNRCPERPSIPVWMIVFGAVYLVQAILERIAARLRLKIELQLRQSPEYQVMPANRLRAVIENEFSRRYRRMDQMDQLLQTFGFIWFVIGSVWVFGCSKCKSDFDEDLNTGCDVTAYRFSLVLIVILYVMLAMPFLAIMLYIFAVTFCRDTQRV